MEEAILRITHQLRRPAGNSKRFQTKESIQEHREEFVTRCHTTWKQIHQQAIFEIFSFDAFLKREKTHPTNDVVKEFGAYNRAVWRKVNDSIVWSILGMERHVMKRLCLYRPRNFLEDCNDKHALRSLKVLNEDPLSIALWTDATSCVDIGDVMYVKDGMRPDPVFIELKEGEVNAAIAELIRKDSRSAPETFVEKYGQKGEDQLERVLRQVERADQAFALLRDEAGTDPVTGLEIEVHESHVEVQTYDEILNAALRNAIESRSETIEKVDCLWILANLNLSGPANTTWTLDTLEKLIDRRPEQSHHSWKRDTLSTLERGVNDPMARPIFMRHIEADIVGSILFGDLRERVHLYFDWEEFGEIVSEEGGALRWSSKKNAGRLRSRNPRIRPLFVRGLVPIIEVEQRKALLTDRAMVEVLFDGLSPRSLARRFINALKAMNRDSNKSGEGES